MTQDENGKELEFDIVDEWTLQEEKEKYTRELKLEEMFADAPDELKSLIDEAKKDPIEDLINVPGKPTDNY